MALTQNREVDHYIDQELRSHPVGAGEHIHKGALVGESSGYARSLVAGDRFCGLAYEEIDNSGGGNGDASVRVYTVGDFGLPLAGAVLSDIGRPVFASGDDTLTFTGHGCSHAGSVVSVPAADGIILRIDPDRRGVRTITHAVEDTGAGVDIPARAAHVFAQDAWLTAVRVVNRDVAAAGIDGANLCTVTVSTDAGIVATKAYGAAGAFPDANMADDLGAPAFAHVEAGGVILVSVSNGGVADPTRFSWKSTTRRRPSAGLGNHVSYPGRDPERNKGESKWPSSTPVC